MYPSSQALKQLPKHRSFPSWCEPSAMPYHWVVQQQHAIITIITTTTTTTTTTCHADETSFASTCMAMCCCSVLSPSIWQYVPYLGKPGKLPGYEDHLLPWERGGWLEALLLVGCKKSPVALMLFWALACSCRHA